MTRYRQQRPQFVTRAMEEQANRDLDFRLELQDREREERLNAAVERELAARTPEQIADDDAELARLDAIAAEDSRQREDRLRRRRSASTDQLSTMGT
jgi:hypothetical protein